MNWKNTRWIVLLFLIIWFIRLYLSFLNPLFSSDESYFHIRQVENILSTGKPLFYDPLSWSGSRHHFFATFHYIAGILSLIFSKEIIFKVLPQLFAGLLVFPIYGILKILIKNEDFALVGTSMSAFIPILFVNTVNIFTPLSFGLFLFFLMTYLFLKLEKNSYVYIILLIIFSFSHPLVLLFSASLFGYVLFSKIENINLKKIEKEIIIFSVFFPLWVYFIFYRNVLLIHAKDIIWQNIPNKMLTFYFENVSLLGGIYHIGVITLVLGLYTCYSYLFELKDKQTYLMMGIIFVMGILLWQKMIALVLGGIMIGLFICILSIQGLYDLFNLIKKTKFSKINNLIMSAIIILFVVTSLIPGVVDAKNKILDNPSKDEINAFNWIKNRLPSNSTIIALPEEGNYLNKLANAKNIIDTDFLIKPNSNIVYNDLRRIFLTHSNIEAVELMSKYKADYLLVTQNSKKHFNLKNWAPEDSECFELIYDNEAKIYKKTCRRVKTFE